MKKYNLAFTPIKSHPISLGVYLFIWLTVFVMFIFFGGLELRLAQQYQSLNLLRHYIPVSCEASTLFDNKIVHIDCPLNRLHTFYPPSEFLWNIQPFKGVFYEMKVEMYQWALKSRFLFFVSLQGEWSSSLVELNSRFSLFYNGYVNPTYIPSVNGAGRHFATQLFAGNYHINRKHLVNFNKKIKLTLTDDGYYTPSTEHPPTTVSYQNTQVYENGLYTGDPKSPKIGDIRITFWGNAASHLSAVCQQKYNYRKRVHELVEYHEDTIKTGTNSTKKLLKGGGNSKVNSHFVREIVYEGDFTPAEIFKHYLSVHSGSFFIRWLIRSLYFIVLMILVSTSYGQFHKKTLPMDFFNYPYFVIGSGLIALAIEFFSAALLWLTFYSKTAILYGSFGVLLAAAGVTFWRTQTYQKSYRDPSLNEGIDLLPIGLDEPPVVTESSDCTCVNTPQHYYQPV